MLEAGKRLRLVCALPDHPVRRALAMAFSAVLAQGARAEQIAPPAAVANGEFGYTVASAPDLTGDGFAELLVGAWKETPSGFPSASGAAHIHHAHTGQLIRTLTSSNAIAAGNFGAAASAVPDIDGDGVADIIIGAPGEIPPSSSLVSGAAHVFSGAGGALLFILKSTNEITQGRFGWSVAGAGDLTGDGRGEILIGAPDETVGANAHAGRAYLFNGATGALIQALLPTTSQADAAFGSSVAAAPDLTGDGVPDLVIAAALEDIAANTDAGRIYVYNGALAGAGSASFVPPAISSPAPEGAGQFGCSIAGVSDLNSDGRGDILVGACGETSGVTSLAGRAHVISGATGALIRTLNPPAPQLTGFFGWSVAAAPDITGDGLPETLIGAIRETPPAGQSRAGRAHLFNGANGTFIRTVTSPNQDANGQFGGAVGGSPDLNADGRGELIVGAPRENPGAAPTDSGMAYVFDGLTGIVLVLTPTPTPSPTLTPSPTASATTTLTPTATETLTVSPTGTASPAETESPTPSPSPSPTPTETETPGASPTWTATPTSVSTASRDWNVYE